MNDKQRRLKEIELGLTPQQLVLLWLRNAVKCTLAEGALQIVGPREAILKAVHTSVRNGMKGQPEPQIERAILQAHREADLLFNVVIKVNAAVLESLPKHRREYYFIVAHLKAMPCGHAHDKESVKEFCSAVLMFIEDIVVLDAAISELSANRFDGHNLLFCDSKSELKQQLESAGFLVRCYNQLASNCGLEQTQIGEVQGSLWVEVDQQVSRWIDLALLQVFIDLGEHSDALGIARRLLREPSSENREALYRSFPE